MLPKIINGLANAKIHFSSRENLDISNLSDEMLDGMRNVFGNDLSPEQVVYTILNDINIKGDEAVRHYAKLFDGTELKNIEIDQETINNAHSKVDNTLFESLQLAAERIKSYHQATLPSGDINISNGLIEKVLPLEKVGIYIPGGTASYPSTVLMTAIPAKMAGVKEVVLTSPSVEPVVLAAAALAGVDRVFRVGGVQAIGAMAYGTDSIPKVDKICGPGNALVTYAKKMVYGKVDIDGLYGPTETVLIADHNADPVYCAADMIAQAEHDPMASPILVTTRSGLIPEVERELNKQISDLERVTIIRSSLVNRGRIVLVNTLTEAIELANFIAPEHLCLLVENPWELIPLVKNAGGVFAGEYSPEVVGDYIAGPSHVMPTGGTARFFSALGVHQFLKRMPIISLSRKDFTGIAQQAAIIARSEGLTAHAKALEIRTDTGDDE